MNKIVLRKALLLLVSFCILTGILLSCAKPEEPTPSGETATMQTTLRVTSTAKTVSTQRTTSPASTNAREDDEHDEYENPITEDPTGGDDEDPDIDDAYDRPIWEQGYDFQGRTIGFAIYGVNNTGKPKHSTTSVNNELIAQTWDDAEIYFNCLLDRVVIANAMADYIPQLTNLIMSGMNNFDFFYAQPYTVFPYMVNNNLVLPIDEYMDFENDPVLNNPWTSSVSYWKGRHYSVHTQYGVPWGVLYNPKILEQEGIPDLLDWVDNKQWTWERFLDVALTCTRDYNGDGFIDQWGCLDGAPVMTVSSFVYSNGSVPIGYDGDSYVFQLDEPQTLKGLQFVSDLFNAYEVAQTNLPLFPQGLGAMLTGVAAYYGRDNCVPNGIYAGWVPMPMGPDVNDYIGVAETCSYYCLAANTQHPKDMAHLLYYLYTYTDPRMLHFITREEMSKNSGTAYFPQGSERQRNLYGRYALNALIDVPMVVFTEARSIINVDIMNAIVGEHITPVYAISTNKARIQESINAIQ